MASTKPAAQALQVRLLSFPRAQAAEPRGDRVGADRDEQRAVLDVPDPGLGHDPHAVAQPHLHERVVEPARRAQGRHRRLRPVDTAVGEDDHGGAAGQVDPAGDHLVEGRLEAGGPARRLEQQVEGGDPFPLGESGRVRGREDPLGQDVHGAGRPAARPQPGAVAERHLRLEDPRVADGVDGRARLLREAELEVVLEPPRQPVEHGRGRGVVAHRAHRRLARPREGREQHVLVLAGHPEGELQPAQVRRRRGRIGGRRLEDHAPRRDREALRRDQPVHRVREQHVPVLQAHHDGVAGAEELLLLDGAEVHGAGELARGERVALRGEEPQRPQAVAVEVRDRLVAVAGDDRGGAVAGAEEDAHRLVEGGEPVARRRHRRGLGQQGQDAPAAGSGRR